MAEITLGIGTSHGPLLMLEPEQWDRRTDSDKVFPGHPFQGGTYKYDELLSLRHSNYLTEMNSMENRHAHFARCQVQLDELGARLRDSAPDALVILGDDHKEWFLDDKLPAITVYCGGDVVNRGVTPGKAGAEDAGHTHEGIENVASRRHLPHDVTYPCVPDLARHIVEQAIDAEFDVASSSMAPLAPDGGPKCLGHAYTFIVRRLLKDLPIPMVPIIVNTYYPPNQPSAKRCWNFGKTLGNAITSWKEDAKVAVIASGGLSHFAIDEEFDIRMLSALKHRDADAIVREPEALFQSGTSETKCWIMAAGAMAETPLRMELLDYVPCYRSDAGTGNAMAFATWQ